MFSRSASQLCCMTARREAILLKLLLLLIAVATCGGNTSTDDRRDSDRASWSTASQGVRSEQNAVGDGACEL